MKPTHFALIFLLGSILFAGCNKDAQKVDKEGLTEDIRNLLPDGYLEELDELGMPIYGGANPPNVVGRFLSNPNVLLSSNRQTDSPGRLYNDEELSFFDQDNSDLTIGLNIASGGTTGSETTAFIVGDECHFSVFSEVFVQSASGVQSTRLMVYSGCIDESGIEAYHSALYMKDDFGDPTGGLIEVGAVRVFFDHNGLAERQ